MANLEKATAEFQSFVLREIELLAQKREKASQLKQAELQAGDAYLVGQPAESIRPVLQLKTELEAINRTIATCPVRRLKALKNKWGAEAEAIRKQAAEKTDELQALNKKTGKLLTELAELECVPYDSQILARQEKTDLDFWIPRSVSLQVEIDGLERKARELEIRKVPSIGFLSVDNVSIDELVGLVLRQESAVPRSEQILEWIGACEAVGAARGKGDFAAHKLDIRLSWNSQGIDWDRSHVFISDYADPHPRRGFDIPSGTFRATKQPMESRA